MVKTLTKQALTYIAKNGLETAFPRMLSNQLSQSTLSGSNYLEYADDESVLVEQLEALTRRMESTRESVGETTWCNTGLNDISRLAKSVKTALFCGSDAERYHELTWLRSWLFWFELRHTGYGEDWRTLTAWFYELLLVAVPMFPLSYQASLLQLCQCRLRDTSPHS